MAPVFVMLSGHMLFYHIIITVTLLVMLQPVEVQLILTSMLYISYFISSLPLNSMSLIICFLCKTLI